MGLAKFKERRLSDRKHLTGLLPGRLMIAASKTDLNCRPVDISAHGLGIVLNKELAPGTALLLNMPDRTVQLEVAWSKPDFGKQDMFRYGLICTQQEINLEELFIAAGCIR